MSLENMENTATEAQNQDVQQAEPEMGNATEQKSESDQAQQNDQGGSEKTFTQKEVNEIIKGRLDRERKKQEMRENPDEYLKSLEEREAEVLKRELQATAKDKLSEYRVKYGGTIYPEEMLNVLDYSSEETMNGSFDALHRIFEGLRIEYFKKFTRPALPKTGGAPNYMQPIEDAFKPKQ